MNWNEIIILLISSLGSAATGFFFSKSKYKQEVLSMQRDNESSEIDNLKKSIEIYQTIITDLRNEVEILKSKVSMLEKKNNYI